MSTQAEHIRLAEEYLDHALTLRRNGDSPHHWRRTDEGIAQKRAEWLAIAQVHATLAITATKEDDQ